MQTIREYVVVTAICLSLLTLSCGTSNFTLGEAEVHYHVGGALRDEGQLEEALSEYDEAIRLDPLLASAYTNPGKTYFAQAQFQRAMQDYNEAIRLSPRIAEVYYVRGDAYVTLNQPDKAIADLTKSLSYDRRAPATYISRSVAYTLLGMDEEAQRDVDTAVGLGSVRETLEAKLDEIKSRR